MDSRLLSTDGVANVGGPICALRDRAFVGISIWVQHQHQYDQDESLMMAKGGISNFAYQNDKLYK